MKQEVNDRQFDLFAKVMEVYASGEEISNAQLYESVAERAGLDAAVLDKRVPIGQAGAMRSPLKRKIRWYQQTLRQMGVLSRVPGKRGQWKMSDQAGDLTKATADIKLVAFSTELGVAIWGRCNDVFGQIDVPVVLSISSPPYPLRTARAYGNPTDAQYTDFICHSLEPIVRNLVDGGSIVLNVSNEIFESKSPARSLYLERMILALHDRLGLHLMDRIPWVNYSKPPGPTWWACVNRVHLSAAYEPIYWFTNNPAQVRSDNRRVLEPHTDRHLKMVASGGANRTAVYGDGAYRIRPDSYRNATPGKIPRNVMEKGHACGDTRAYRRKAQELGLPVHGAMQPTSIADFFIRFLTAPGELVVDPFGGTLRTGLAAERLGRRWLVAEQMLQYVRGAAELFRGSAGFELHPDLV